MGGCVSSAEPPPPARPPVAVQQPVAVDRDAQLLEAAKGGDVAKARAALNGGANRECKDKDGNTPLHVAAYNGQLECVRLLLERGADKEAKNNNGKTPLHLAAEAGHLECVRLLLERGADKDAKDNNGKTPLELCKDIGFDDAYMRAAKEATRALLRSQPPQSSGSSGATAQAVAAPKAAAVPATSAAVPADVAALLSQLSLSQHAPALVTHLGLTCAADASMLTDADLEQIGMKPLERRKLLAAVAPSPVAPAPARVGCEVMISYRVSETGEGGDNSVFTLKKALEARGYSVFVGEAAIQGGEEWPETIAAGVRDCAAFVVLCSPTYGDTVWTKRELVMADNLRKPLIPVWHSGAYPPKAAEIYLGGKQRIPGGNFGEGYVKARIAHERVAEEVAAALARAGVAPSRK